MNPVQLNLIKASPCSNSYNLLINIINILFIIVLLETKPRTEKDLRKNIYFSQGLITSSSPLLSYKI